MSWPGLDLVPPDASEVHEFTFTGSTATFDLPDLPPGTLSVYARGGRGGGCPGNLRLVTSVPAAAGSWSVLVGGDGSGISGGYGGGGAGGTGSGGHGDGTGGGGGTFLFSPDGSLAAACGGAGGKAGAPAEVTPGWPFQLSDLTPTAAYSAYLSGQNFAIGAPGWFGGQGGNLNPDRSYGLPGTGEAETYEGWLFTVTPDPGYGGAYGESSFPITEGGLPIGCGGDGATLDLFAGPGGGGGGGGSTGGGGGGAVNWEHPYFGNPLTGASWGIGPGNHGASDTSAFLPPYPSEHRSLVAAGVPLIDPLNEPNGKLLVFYLEGPPVTGGWGFGIHVQ